ncbi:hypothetical protein IW261DRAFT_691705 [Armillaria novae-zelandiae]|uniref:Vps72/YL1 C-terminal domain-containing protein n=1 Tax=Armillaria novae-zelandiae TaxID=153914 RepID=A0AA39UC81_9AGAR|nr:hypothetical protein IW261DRAFT_691705 [Armillaria novae-zelandiae]
MPPKGVSRRKAAADGSSTPNVPSLAVQLSYLHSPKPFKNPYYSKNVNRRAKNLKTVLSQERERERAERERRKLAQPDVPLEPDEMPTYASIEAPPSLLPMKHYCDVTGLEAPYTDPATGLRFHDKSVYQVIKGMGIAVHKFCVKRQCPIMVISTSRLK